MNIHTTEVGGHTTESKGRGGERTPPHTHTCKKAWKGESTLAPACV